VAISALAFEMVLVVELPLLLEQPTSVIAAAAMSATPAR